MSGIQEFSADPGPRSLAFQGGLAQRPSPSPATAAPAAVAATPKKNGNDLLQQRLRSWQPSLSARGVFWCYSIIGVLFISIGVILLAINHTTHEITTEYTIPTGTVDDVTIPITANMKSPIYVYYELDGFHQNHRRYVKSREDKQLLGSEVFTTAASLSNCDPAASSPLGGDLVLYPCGLVARSVFTDRLYLFHAPSNGGTTSKIALNTESNRISWESDVEHKYRNIDVSKYQDKMDMWIFGKFPVQMCEPASLAAEKKAVYVKKRTSGQSEIADCDFDSRTCNYEGEAGDFGCNGADWEKKQMSEAGVESGHFINWMRTAGLPKFRKLYGVVDTNFSEGDVVTGRVQSDFDVASFGGKKRIVLATVSKLGGQNYFLAVGYIVVGVLSLMFAFVFTIRHRLGGEKTIKHLD